jgi:hypothetical protein
MVMRLTDEVADGQGKGFSSKHGPNPLAQLCRAAANHSPGKPGQTIPSNSAYCFVSEQPTLPWWFLVIVVHFPSPSARRTLVLRHWFCFPAD